MKKTYKSPLMKVVTLDCSSLMTLSLQGYATDEPALAPGMQEEDEDFFLLDQNTKTTSPWSMWK